MDQRGDAVLLSICGVEDQSTAIEGLAWCVLITPDLRPCVLFGWGRRASGGSYESCCRASSFPGSCLREAVAATHVPEVPNVIFGEMRSLRPLGGAKEILAPLVTV